MKRSVAVKLVLDAALAVLLVLVMATALVQEAPHEYLGVALFALVIAHVAVNRRWFASLFRGRWSVVRALQVASIVGLVACIAGQVASSVVLSKYAFGFLPAIEGAAWARRVHMVCSYWAFMFAFAHVGLQFKTVIRRIGESWPGKAMTVLFVVVACFGAYSFAALGLPAYLAGQVQFAQANFDAPLLLTIAQYASVAVLIAGVFHYARRVLERP